jgi:hypothetical protein
MSGVVRAQEGMGGPTSRNTTGIESERYLYEVKGLAYPSGPLTYSCSRSMAGGVATYQVAAHRNHLADGPLTPLFTLTADYTAETPRWSLVSMSMAGSNIAPLVASRSSAIVAGRMTGEDGTVFVVMEVFSSFPYEGNGWLAKHQANVLATTENQATAVQLAQSKAAEREAEATAFWVANEFAVAELPTANITNQPVPATVERSVQRVIGRNLDMILNPVIDDCFPRYGRFPSTPLVGGDPGPVDWNPTPAASDWFSVLEIVCEGCRLNKLCQLGPMWRVSFVVRGVPRRGNYWFEIKLEMPHNEWHLDGAPQGSLLGDEWGIIVMWSAQLCESFPLKLPVWDPGQLPPNRYDQQRFRCMNIVSCPS